MGFTSTFKSTSEKAEGLFNVATAPIKPYLPSISRFMIVATFYEDALRIMWQWKDHILYLEAARGFPKYLAPVFLGFNSISMLIFASCMIMKRHVSLSVAVLAAVIVGQAFGYGLVFNMMFLLRNLSVTGGLLLCMSESILRKKSLSKRSSMFASLPQLTNSEKHQYYQLAGRVLLVFLFLGFLFNGEWNLFRILESLFGLTACGMVMVGFRAKWSATFLVSLLCLVNMFVNDWWSIQHSTTQRDFLRYDFFQCLSIMGGLLLLVSIGPGGFSYDEKKKEF